MHGLKIIYRTLRAVILLTLSPLIAAEDGQAESTSSDSAAENFLIAVGAAGQGTPEEGLTWISDNWSEELLP